MSNAPGGYYVTMLEPENKDNLSIVRGDLVRFLYGPFASYEQANATGPQVMDYMRKNYPGSMKNVFRISYLHTDPMPKGAFNDLLISSW